MEHPARELARQLAARAEAVCRHYLSNGVKCGRWWCVGDVHNTPGRSMYVRLHGSACGTRPAGKWADAAQPGEHGDLLDLIALNRGCRSLTETMAEARRFLGGTPLPPPNRDTPPLGRSSRSPAERAQRLFRAARPIPRTPAEAYLRARGITQTRFWCLRYHDGVYYRAHDGAPLQRLPAWLAAVTDLDGRIVAVHRTWIDPRSASIAPLFKPKRALGEFLGAAVRFGAATESLIAGEGLETVLSLKSACPELPMAAGLSANHLAGLLLPPTLKRLWVALDEGHAGARAGTLLCARAAAQGVDARDIAPLRDDFNTDLCRLGHARFTARVRALLAEELARVAAPPS